MFTGVDWLLGGMHVGRRIMVAKSINTPNMKRPSFQFYPADWRQNGNLRRCSDAARGVWVDILCVLHDSDEYGIIRWPLEDLARAAGVKLKYVEELVEKDVLKGADADFEGFIYIPRHAGQDGEPVTLIAKSQKNVWFSSRFVRDEWIRKRRGGDTRFKPADDSPQPSPKSPPNRAVGGSVGDGSSSSFSSSFKKPPTPLRGQHLGEDDFENFWAQYPNKKGKANARKEFLKLPREILPTILAGLEAYKKTDQWTKDDGKFIPFGSTFIHQKRWEDEVETMTKTSGRYKLIP